MCSLENGLLLLRYAGRPTPKMMKRWSRKTATNLKEITPQTKRGTLRERYWHICRLSYQRSSVRLNPSILNLLITCQIYVLAEARGNNCFLFSYQPPLQPSTSNKAIKHWRFGTYLEASYIVEMLCVILLARQKLRWVSWGGEVRFSNDSSITRLVGTENGEIWKIYVQYNIQE